MKPTSIFLTLLSSLTLATAEYSYYCPMARDKTNMIQKAYCCDTLSPAPHTDLAFVSDDCKLADAKVVGNQCEGGDRPVCCYQIERKSICTAYAQFQDV